MGIFSKKEDIVVVYDALSLVAGLEVIAGNPSQTYNVNKGTYMPTRADGFTPCVITPKVSVSDPEMVITQADIANVKYYEGVPKADDTNLITDKKGGYKVVTVNPTTSLDYPKWSLVVNKNFPPETPCDIYAVITFIDTRCNQEVKVSRSITFSTATFKTDSLKVCIDKPSMVLINPLVTDGWKQTIKAVLRENDEDIPSAEAEFKWMIREGNSMTWREITADELQVCVSGKTGDTLTFDVGFFRKVAFQVTAKKKNTQKTCDSNVTYNVAYPKQLEVNVIQRAGGKMKADLSTMVEYECQISDSRGIIGEDKYSLFDITWKAESSKPGAPTKVIGNGRRVSFIPYGLDYDGQYGISVYAEVKMRVVTCVVTDGGKLVTSGGKAVTIDKFE